jgi:peptidyl-prolyl cis-trans isomerase D
MLQNIRDNSKGVVSGILIGLLVVIFALTGAETLFNSDPNARSVIKVNGEAISEMEISRATATQKQQIADRYGDSVPPEFLSDEYLRTPVVENLIQRLLLVQKAKESGLTASDAAINEQIVRTPQFQQENGAFDSIRYQSLLRNFGYTPSTYKKALVEDVLISQLTSGVVDTSFSTPAEVDKVIELNFQTRSFDYLILPSGKVREEVTVSDAEIRQYYESKPQEFNVPEEVAVDYIDLNLDNMLDGIDISEDEIRKQYEQNRAAFVASPERQVAHILIESNDPAVIEEITGKLAADENFAELARQYSDDLGSKEDGGDLGFTTGDTFPENFETALAALAVGEVSAPVVTDAGTHFIKKLSERGVEVPSFESERDRIASQLKRDQAEHEFVVLVERMRDLSFNAESLADVARELGVSVQNTGLIPRTGGDTDISRDNQFVAAAFSADVLEHENSSEVIELAPTRAAVLKKTEYKASHVSPLEDVSDRIALTLKEEKVRELMTAKAVAFKQEIAAGKTLEQIAADNTLEVKTVENTGRNSQDVERDVLFHAFSIAKPAAAQPVIDGVVLGNGDYAIVSLKSVASGADQFPAEQKSILAAQLASISGQNEFRNLQNLLQAEAKIKQ